MERWAFWQNQLSFERRRDWGPSQFVMRFEGVLEAGQGVTEKPKMTLKAQADDYYSVIMGEINPTHAVFNGKLRIEGDMGLAMKLATMFEY